MNFSCSEWSRWTTYLAIVTSLQPHVIRNCTSKRDFRRGHEIFCSTIFCKLFVPVSYRNHHFDGWFLINGGIVFQNGDYIFKINRSQIESVISEISKIELFEGEKLFSHKIICFFGSILIVWVLSKREESFKELDTHSTQKKM